MNTLLLCHSYAPVNFLAAYLPPPRITRLVNYLETGYRDHDANVGLEVEPRDGHDEGDGRRLGWKTRRA